jgi:RimJ/RimL family protein N-acetyltransferase
MLRSREMPPPPPDTFTPSLILNAAHQGCGYAYEATYALFDYLFERKGARRIYTYVDDYNARSQHICEKMGMHREGLFREFVSFVNDAEGNPVYENTIQYAILKREWMAKRTSGE